ncbi:acyl-CoA dehydrogenase [Primorskyibacter flagellatus]|uniref:Medium-chain specific acyl-CoA dehydrogenase, mitochondrial n=1 Tax=Primorskyibacter flagellatus TaxID=1387277 RepID=A0A917EK32_9RHOB|nr:acyl-CoA dehydrogenase family protein [Primorskyibacter flagellatus]GGE46081.1 acyl-CoA dehydrogenase [Primorskyibacter flagellatus]
MDFNLPEDVLMTQDVVKRFVRDKLIPLEPLVIRREVERGMTDDPILPKEVEDDLQRQTQALGLWGIDAPEEFGGQDLGALMKCVVIEQMKHSIVPLVLPPDSPNLYYLKQQCTPDQAMRYLDPYVNGEKKSCLALSEPEAGSDAAAIKTRADRRGDKWVLNGEKIWISNARRSDFMIVIAVTDPEKRKRGGMTAFLVDRDTPGVTIPTSFPMIGEYHPYAVHFQDVELGDEQVLGEVGQAFVPLSNRLGIRRMEIAARSLGLASRAIDMMIEHANRRKTFGAPLADRQNTQFWISDSWQELEMARLATYRLAWRIDQGEKDVRREAAMVKIQATEMATRVVDRAIQLHGGMGLSKELPLEYMSRILRVFRIVEGASEIHRWTIARDLLRNGRPEA